jgi:5-methylcytosine-specific restriction enzyme subunit McrC
MRAANGIPIANLYYLLAYAFELVDERVLTRAEAEAFDAPVDLLAALLEAGMARQIKRGLYREYVVQREELATLRGKVDVAASLRHKMARQPRLTCEFDEYSQDNAYNQALKAVALLVVRSPSVKRELRAALKKSLLYFSHVRTVDVRSIAWASFVFTRENKSYRLLLSLCQLLVEGMLMADAPGGAMLAPAVNDATMARLFERFVLRYFIVHHAGLHPAAPQIPWALDEDYTGTMLPVMKSDVVLCAGGGCGGVSGGADAAGASGHFAAHYAEKRLVIDTKFYGQTYQEHGRFGAKTVHSGNLYQLFCYVKNLAAGAPRAQVAGMLLYARTEDVCQPNERFVMVGNVIYVRTLDLSQEFSGIARELDAIAALLEG